MLYTVDVLVVSNADRVVFPEVNKTKGDVVAYYERVASRALPHLAGRLLSIKRFPKGLAGAGFFQKNVPDHYPASIARVPVPRSKQASKKHKDPEQKERDVTVYPVIGELEHLPYLGNQGAIELHMCTSKVPELFVPDRVILDLDPPPGAFELVRKAAFIARDGLLEFGLPSAAVATGSKGYHVIAPISGSIDAAAIAATMQKLGALLTSRHPDVLTTTFRIANRGGKVFVDWLRNNPGATVVSPYSLRATPRATVATPLAWDELETTAPDAFTIDDAQRLLDRPDPLIDLKPTDVAPFVAAVEEAFTRSGLVMEAFDRFRAS